VAGWCSTCSVPWPSSNGEIIRDRTMAGLAAARARDRNGGRPSKLGADQVRAARRLYDEREHTVEQIGSMFGVSRTYIYLYIGRCATSRVRRSRRPMAGERGVVAGRRQPAGSRRRDRSGQAAGDNSGHPGGAGGGRRGGRREQAHVHRVRSHRGTFIASQPRWVARRRRSRSLGRRSGWRRSAAMTGSPCGSLRLISRRDPSARPRAWRSEAKLL